MLAIDLRRPCDGVLVQSDQGSQYASENCRSVSKQAGISSGRLNEMKGCWQTSGTGVIPENGGGN